MRSTNCPRPVSGKALYNSQTGELKQIPCNTWGCPVCGPAKAHRLGILAAAAKPERFITLSRVGPDLQTVLGRLTVLSRALRRSGYGWDYLAVPEIHQNGFWHLHLLQRGGFIPQKVLSERASSSGMGRVCWIEAIDNRERAVPAYLVKYITKEMPETVQRSKSSKRYRASRGFWPGGLEEHKHRVFGPSSSGWTVEKIGPYSDPA